MLVYYSWYIYLASLQIRFIDTILCIKQIKQELFTVPSKTIGTVKPIFMLLPLYTTKMDLKTSLKYEWSVDF